VNALSGAAWAAGWSFVGCVIIVCKPLSSFVYDVSPLPDDATGRIGDAACVALHVLITAATLVLPIVVIEMSNAPFLSGLLAEFVSCILFLKLVSYAHVMHTVRYAPPLDRLPLRLREEHMRRQHSWPFSQY
jgi:hypothetical protein